MDISTHLLSNIKLNNAYLRTDTNIDALKKSIDNIGLINPITINQSGELLAGARRYQAMLELGWKETFVQIVDCDSLQQELISIDENLVRIPLSKLEFEECLNRGREIYESLNPNAVKVDLSNDSISPENKQKQKEKEQLDTDSFTAITAEKIGLSKSIINSAIKRDELASDSVKKARCLGELNATQTNEIIALDKETQEKILPFISDKTVKEAKQIIKVAKEKGVDAALETSQSLIPLPKEYTLLKSPLKRVNKNLSRILLEELTYNGPEQAQINQEMLTLKENLDRYFQMVNSHLNN